jgi:hypothetical protein
VIEKLIIKPTASDWAQAELEFMRQGGLFESELITAEPKLRSAKIARVDIGPGGRWPEFGTAEILALDAEN